MTNIFGYLRVSDSSQAKGDGFPRQEKAVRDYAAAHDMEIIKIYKEQWTGTEQYRPVLAEMLVSMEQNHHGVKTVIIERLDRLAREYFVQEAIIRDFKSKGFNLISTVESEGDDVYNNDPSRKLVRQMFGVIAEYEKNMTIAKLRAARDRKRAKTGRCEGRQGYKDTEEGRAMIRHIKALYRAPKYGRRRTLQQIADMLNEEGTRTLDGKLWGLHRVRDIILSR
jgi:DNA invertase Pin-like site-specific DNA recombinase